MKSIMPVLVLAVLAIGLIIVVPVCATSGSVEVSSNVNDANPIKVFNNKPYFIIRGSFEQPIVAQDLYALENKVVDGYQSASGDRHLKLRVEPF
jgi:hypothetical protein